MPLVSVLRQNLSIVPGTQTFNSSGNFIVPPGVTSLVICICGGGGSGGGDNSNLGGGGGGSGVRKLNVAVTPGEVIPISIGAGQPFTAAANIPAQSSVFSADSGTITASGGRSYGQMPSSLGGLGVNGGGDGAKVDFTASSCTINSSKGGDCSATCDGSTKIGGAGFCATTTFGNGGGGAGGFGNGGQSAPGSGAPSPGAANSGAGGGGSWANQGNGATGGSGKCVVYWGGTHPPLPVPV